MSREKYRPINQGNFTNEEIERITALKNRMNTSMANALMFDLSINRLEFAKSLVEQGKLTETVSEEERLQDKQEETIRAQEKQVEQQRKEAQEVKQQGKSLYSQLTDIVTNSMVSKSNLQLGLQFLTDIPTQDFPCNITYAKEKGVVVVKHSSPTVYAHGMQPDISTNKVPLHYQVKKSGEITEYLKTETGNDLEEQRITLTTLKGIQPIKEDIMEIAKKTEPDRENTLYELRYEAVTQPLATKNQNIA